MGLMDRMMIEEDNDLRMLYQDLAQIAWYIHHPPAMFAEPGHGTDLLRQRPKVDLSQMRQLASGILSDLQMLDAAHYRGETRWGT